jgi:hypothetical protein
VLEEVLSEVLWCISGVFGMGCVLALVNHG